MAVDGIDYLPEAREFHRLHVEPYKGKPKGCRDSEIRALEESFGFELPVAYKQYLSWMGKDYNGIFVGCDWFITNVDGNTALVPELLEENGITFGLPEHYLCFFSHQGYMAAWFELPKADENPLSWFYHEALSMEQPVIEGTFAEILLKDMRGLAWHLPRIYGRAT